MKGNEEKKEEKGMMGEGQNKQQGGAPGGAIKEKVDNTKNKIQKIKKIINFIKKHPLIAKVLFWVILIILIIIILTVIIYEVKGIKEKDASTSFEDVQAIIKTMNIGTSEDGGNGTQNIAPSYMTTGGTIKENPENPGEYGYYLLYGDFSDEQKVEKINKIKSTLAKRNITIYSNQCLLFLAMLEENGLDISHYRKDELEAMYMFYKAEVATSALDLRTEEDMYENGEYKYSEDNLIVPVKEITNTNNSEDITYDYSYQQENYVEDDYSDDSVCGTIRVQKVTYNSSSEGENIGTTTVLTYMPYEQFTEQIGMKDSDSRGADITKHFTIDGENNLIVAGWSYTNISYNITCEGNSELLEELKEQNKGSTQTNIYKYKKIPYLNYISKYTMPFSFLMSLLATTSDADFCKELAKIAETSYITITLHEEFSQMTTTNTTEHTHYDKIYATLNADVGGTITTQSIGEKKNINVSGYDSYEDILSNYGYYSDSNSSMNEEKLPYGQYNYTYQWKNNSKIYYFKFTIYRGEEVKNSRKLTYQNIEQVETIKTNTAGRFINKNRELALSKPTEITGFTTIPEEVESYEEYHNRILNLNAWTKNVETHYTIVGTTVNEYNSYSMEVTEVNNWYEYYKKTYSKVESEDIGQPDINHTNIIVPTITNKEITEQNEINNLDYVQEISQEQKNKVISDSIGTSDFSNPKFEIKKINEEVYTYGNEEVTVTTTGTRYKRTGDQKEIIQVKVQEGNQEAVLTISADAIAVLQGQTEDTSSDETSTTVTKEQFYGTTDAYKDGFLNIYDKYPYVQNDLNSIEEWTYEMLDSRQSCINITNLLRYLLFLYDGTNLGVTEYNLILFKPDDFNSADSSSLLLIEYIHYWENSSSPPTNEDGTCYIIEDDGAGHPTVGYGVDIENSGYKDKFIEAGYPTEIGGEVPIDFVDAIEKEELERCTEEVKALTAGLDLTEYQINALISRAYNCGVSGAINTERGNDTKKNFIDAYEAYWNKETDDEYGKIIGKFQDTDKERCLEHELYKNYMCWPVTSNGKQLPGLVRRRISEWILFKTGYYYELEKWHVSGGRIIECAKYIHEYMEENQYSYCVYNDSDNSYEELGIMHDMCGLNDTFEASKTGFHNTCCATYVSWVLQEAGYITEEEHVERGLNGASNIDSFLREKGWQEVMYSELEPGDILYYSYRTC